MKKTLYIIPGFGETVRMKNYRAIKNLAKKDFEIIAVKINWSKNKTISDYIKTVEKQIPNNNPSYILGFSFGAFIAYNLSKKYELSRFIFCTISPYFKTNLKDIPEDSKKYFGEKFINDLNKYKIHSGTKNEAWFLTGEKDWKLAIDTNHHISSKWSGKSQFILIKNTGHELNNPQYTDVLKNIIKSLRN